MPQPSFQRSSRTEHVIGWKIESNDKLHADKNTLFFLLFSSDPNDVVPLHTNCPMTTLRRGRWYMATVARGNDLILQGDKSDVQLQIHAQCPQMAYLMEVRTDLTNLTNLTNCSLNTIQPTKIPYLFDNIQEDKKQVIPDDECFIAPVVEVIAPAQTDTSAYVLKIPHCLREGDDLTKVKVRMLLENILPIQAVVQVPTRKDCTDGVLFYEIDDNSVELHTPHFCQIFCTICQVPYHCLEKATNFFFGKFESLQEEGETRHEVEIRPYFCSVPYQKIQDFRAVSFIKQKQTMQLSKLLFISRTVVR